MNEFFKRFLELPQNKQEEFYSLLRAHLLEKYLTYDEMGEHALFLLNNYPEQLGLFRK